MSENWESQLGRAVDERFDQLVDIRRRMHRHPELSGHEYDTTRFLIDLIEGNGMKPVGVNGGRGLYVDLHLGPKQQTDEVRRVGLRADIDALPIQDIKSTEYCSQSDGVMHACGHDAHTAIVFGAMSALRDADRAQAFDWPICLRCIFQPAEETCMGAKEMVAAGVVDGLGALFATHVDPARDLGHIGWRPGVLTAHCDELLITVRGRGGHGARPYETDDPISAAANLITNIQSQVVRSIDSQQPVVVSIGSIHGGTSSNVIPGEVQLSGTVRTLADEARHATLAKISQIADGVARMTGTSIVITNGVSGDSVENDESLAEILRQAGEKILGPHGPQRIMRPSMGSEDFAFYRPHVPIAMFRLGSRSKSTGHHALHTPAFDIDEQALLHGAKILAHAAVMWSAPH